MKQKALIAKIEDLETSIANLKKQLMEAGVLRRTYDPYHIPISLKLLREQVDGIKNFLDIEFVTEPAVPSKSIMRRRQNTEED